MNAKVLVTKSVFVSLLVAFATLISVGHVAADHISGAPGAIDTRMRGLDRFGQYLAAIQMSEEHRFETVAVDSVDFRMSRLDRFGQYLAALEVEEQARAASFTEGVELTWADLRANRMDAFHQYLTALETMEQEMHASYLAEKNRVDSSDSFEQYLWALEQ